MSELNPSMELSSAAFDVSLRQAPVEFAARIKKSHGLTLVNMASSGQDGEFSDRYVDVYWLPKIRIFLLLIFHASSVLRRPLPSHRVADWYLIGP